MLRPLKKNLDSAMRSAYLRFGKAITLLTFAIISAQPSYAINLLQAYDAALTNSDILRSSIATKQAAQAQTDVARGAWLPQVSGNIGASSAFGDLPYRQKSTVNVDWGISVSQSIINPGLNTQIELAEIEALRSDVNFESTNLQLLADVAKTYLAVLNAKEQISATNALITFLQSQRKTISAQYEVGLVTRSTVEQVQAQLDSAKAQLAANQAAVNIALSDFYRVTGQSQAPSLSPGKRSLPQLASQDIDYWITQALRYNLQIQNSELNYASADKQVDAAKAAQQPTMNLQGSYGGRVDDGFNNDSGRISLNLNIPIYTGGANMARSKAAAYGRESARYQKNAATYQVEQQVRSLFLNLQAQKAQIAALAQSIKSNQVALESLQAGYEVGTQTIAEVLNAFANLRTSQQSYTLARQNYLLGFINFKQAVGTLSLEDLKKINNALR